jgi:hypothetical protein
MPRARSSPSEPVETTSAASLFRASPMRMIAPLPNCFSICPNAAGLGANVEPEIPDPLRGPG